MAAALLGTMFTVSAAGVLEALRLFASPVRNAHSLLYAALFAVHALWRREMGWRFWALHWVAFVLFNATVRRVRHVHAARAMPAAAARHARAALSGPEPELDVLVIGAGLSGITAGYYLQTKSPGARFRIFEARGELGGTWSLFRFPGVRSDSDMYTYSLSFFPWTGAQAIGDGADILRYLKDAAARFGIDSHVQLHTSVLAMDWSSSARLWTVSYCTGVGASSATVRTITCRAVIAASGYYDYAAGHTPEFVGRERFTGPVVHPQHWPADGTLELAGRRVVIVGSGATAVTLAPALAALGAAVTIVQRSPSYVVALPRVSRLAARLGALFAPATVCAIMRYVNIVHSMLMYSVTRAAPQAARAALLAETARALGSAAPGALVHFAPRYQPWDQRVCVASDGDLFAAVQRGAVTMHTGRVVGFTAGGLQVAPMDSDARATASTDRACELVAADVVVLATGLTMQLLGGATVSVDGSRVSFGERLIYRGAMLDGLPNFFFVFGYAAASWTLRAELVCEFATRVLNETARRGMAAVVPRRTDPKVTAAHAWPLSSGYLERARALLPVAGSHPPWQMHENFARDYASFDGPIDEPSLFWLA